MALENLLISADVVEVQEFPSLASMYRVRSVPLTVINESIQLLGAVPEAELLQKVLQAGAPPASGSQASQA
jgi:predicted DsbA family dithiol-disulfide isomerase